MKNAMKNSSRLLLILKCLLEQTDESHTLTIAEINDCLAEHELFGERKTIRECIGELQTVGYDIRCIRKTQNHYYINLRDFSLAEVRQCDGSCDKEVYRRTVRRVEERRKSEPLVSGAGNNARNTALLGGHVIGPY